MNTEAGPLALLAEASPQEFARKRQQLIVDLIATFRDPEGGHQLQHQIDEMRLNCGGGLPAAHRLFEQIDDMLKAAAPLVKRIEMFENAVSGRHKARTGFVNQDAALD